MPASIEDYALIGDCETAALVSAAGSIDWLCLPRFDSPACLAALLGTPEHGRWRLAPAASEGKAKRSYRPGTLVLETIFDHPEGVVAIVDYMPVRQGMSDSSARANLIRIVYGRRGRIRMRMDLTLRFDYGATVPWVTRLTGEQGIRAVAGPAMAVLRTPVPLHGEDLSTVAEFTVEAGQAVPFVLTYSGSHLATPAPLDAFDELARTQRWWTNWSDQCVVGGDWHGPVRRSLLTLKALTYEPTGGIVAAPTTSLPEAPEGVRNWDYRYCWLRDATRTLRALMAAGYYAEAQAWRGWLVRAVAGSPRSCTVLVASVICGNGNWTGCRVIAGHGLFTSATSLRHNSSSMSTERYSIPSFRLAGADCPWTTPRGPCSGRSSSMWHQSGPSRTQASGKSAADAINSRSPRSWHGSHWTGRSRRLNSMI